jgi:hypothetical protein
VAKHKYQDTEPYLTFFECFEKSLISFNLLNDLEVIFKNFIFGETGVCKCKAGTLPLEPHLQSIFALVILEMESLKLVAWTDLELQSS